MQWLIIFKSQSQTWNSVTGLKPPNIYKQPNNPACENKINFKHLTFGTCKEWSHRKNCFLIGWGFFFLMFTKLKSQEQVWCWSASDIFNLCCSLFSFRVVSAQGYSASASSMPTRQITNVIRPSLYRFSTKSPLIFCNSYLKTAIQNHGARLALKTPTHLWHQVCINSPKTLNISWICSLPGTPETGELPGIWGTIICGWCASRSEITRMVNSSQ